MKATPAVDIQNIVNRFGKHVIHNDISLQVSTGEILGIIGGSGSGKTVLLNSMIGLNQPTAGKVKLLDVSLNDAPRSEQSALRNRIGVVFQAGALFSAFTVLQNIAFPIEELHSVPKDLLYELAQLKLHMVGLAVDDGNKLPAELSGGMRTRAALARALALDPELLFLDEPTSGLDPASAERFVELITDLRHALDLTIVLVTHDLYTLTALSDRIAVLADQSIVALGTLDHVIDQPHPFIQSYFRSYKKPMLSREKTHGI